MYNFTTSTFRPDGNIHSIEKRYTFAGRYGAKGEKRAKRMKATPEQIENQNRRNRARKCRYLIKENFTTEDFFVTLTYRRGTERSMEEAKKDLRVFWRKMRAEYRKRGAELKYIYLIERGVRGSVHVHAVVSTCRGGTGLISRLWAHGHPNYKNLYEEGDYRQLADYMAKVQQKEAGRRRGPRIRDQPERALGRSRNLRWPEQVKKAYARRTVRKIRKAVEAGVTSEAGFITPGYRIDRESIRSGINPYTGLTYLEFTEVPIRRLE